MKYLLPLCLLLLFACTRRSREISPDRKPVKTLMLKKRLSIRNAFVQTGFHLKGKSGQERSGPRDTAGWTLSFSDEFDSLDLKKWRPGQPWGEVHPGNPHQYYDPSELRIKNGLLYLGAAFKPKQVRIGDSLYHVPYAIGLINSDISFSQTYGYFELRSKNPPGAATWPAFWLTGATRWPPEIDIFEMYGKKSGKTVHKQFASLHWGQTGTRSHDYLSRAVQLPRNTDREFHIYACEWSPSFLRFYTDGKLSASVHINARLRKWLQEPMVLIINNCLDARYLHHLPSGFQRNDFVVDWVRVWKRRTI